MQDVVHELPTLSLHPECRNQDVVTIVTVCDNGYTVLLSALLKSIELNLREPQPINLYIISDNISKTNKDKLLKSVNSSLFSLTWLTIEESMPKGTRLPLDHSSFPRSVYIRLFIPYFVDQSISKVLYLDVDMIAVKDISALWQVDIGDHIVAGVVDRAGKVGVRWSGIKNYAELGLSPETKLFNSGLLIIKPQEWRKQKIAEKVIRCTEENAQHAVFPDQYGLNVVLANQWFELDQKWNCYASSEEKDPYIIHFVGTKPLYKSYDNNEGYKTEFYNYLKFTEWNSYKPVSNYFRLLKKINTKLGKKIRGLLRL